MKKKWWLSIPLCLLAFIVVSIIPYIILRISFDIDPMELTALDSTPFLEIVGSLLFIISMGLIYKHLFQIDIIKPLYLRKTYLLFLAGTFCCIVVNYLIQFLFGDSLGDLTVLTQLTVLDVFSIFIITIIMALFEELIFRKYLVDFGEGIGLNLIISTVFSALLFALYHTENLENSWFLIISAILYSYTRYLFKTISFAVGLHFALNLLVHCYGMEIGEPIFAEDPYEDVSLEWALESIRFDVACFILLFSSITAMKLKKDNRSENNN